MFIIDALLKPPIPKMLRLRKIIGCKMELVYGYIFQFFSNIIFVTVLRDKNLIIFNQILQSNH